MKEIKILLVDDLFGAPHIKKYFVVNLRKAVKELGYIYKYNPNDLFYDWEEEPCFTDIPPESAWGKQQIDVVITDLHLWGHGKAENDYRGNEVIKMAKKHGISVIDMSPEPKGFVGADAVFKKPVSGLGKKFF